MKILILTAIALGFSLNASAADGSVKTCHSPDGEVLLSNDNINIVNGIGEIGGPSAQIVVDTLSKISTKCKGDTITYKETTMTREVIAHYQGEEPTDASVALEVMLCTQVRTLSCN